MDARLASGQSELCENRISLDNQTKHLWVLNNLIKYFDAAITSEHLFQRDYLNFALKTGRWSKRFSQLYYTYVPSKKQTNNAFAINHYRFYDVNIGKTLTHQPTDRIYEIIERPWNQRLFV